MQEVEAKKIAKENWRKRLSTLLRSATGAMAAAAVGMFLFTSSYIAGYNERPRVVLYETVAQEHRNTLQQASDEIKAAIGDIGIENISPEAQRKFALALAEINLVREALVPKPDDERGIFLPRFSSLVVAPAHAQSETARAVAKENFRQNLAMGILIVISVFWIICLIVYFTSKDEKKIAFAATMIQTVLGFYIGIFTGLLGLAPPST